ncbi:MAG: DUF2459 domain-containing protein [Planctomycetota bacterium]|nr:DUF2459 domain-containing protein [Planctomycetota bacterium]MDW8372758.1 DUF2459 domain-containing protein [Planctomycetota bacterium]
MLSTVGCTRVPCAALTTAYDQETQGSNLTPVRVYSDGEHSGIILNKTLLPFDVRIPDDVVAALPPEARRIHEENVREGKDYGFVEIGFSEYYWTVEQRRDIGHILSLLVRASPGVLHVEEYTDIQRREAEYPARVWVDLLLTPESAQRLLDEIVNSVQLDGQVWAGYRDGRLIAFLESTLPYRFDFNCHDFTARLLRSVGVPISEKAYRTPGIFADELVAIATMIQRRGSQVVDRSWQQQFPYGLEDPLPPVIGIE